VGFGTWNVGTLYRGYFTDSLLDPEDRSNVPLKHQFTTDYSQTTRHYITEYRILCHLKVSHAKPNYLCVSLALEFPHRKQ
jgi:hypothetical protein